ncbi:MAG TPA: heme-binding domain-containing protein [Blastocatellia bacterium]|jgi:hypothetical protein|nr:heme-binding domain-containing protein [Blastocatellia bacterium]
MKRILVSKIARATIVALALLFLGSQIVRPAKTNPAVDESRTLQSHAQMSPEVAAVLKRGCGDCHSNETVWPWYSDVAPVSWFVIDHVNHGRRHLNFSDWTRYDRQEADELLGDIAKTVRAGAMPLTSYTLLHPEARLTQSERNVIIDWAQAERTRLADRRR